MTIIHARPFGDPRNTYIVDNDDPGAFNKTFAGIPGTHKEQRCCDDKAPSRAVLMTGWYVNGDGQRIVNIIAYWGRPENRALARDGWWNAPTPPGYLVEFGPTGQLMCDGCFGTLWDQFLDDLSSTFDTMVPVIRGIAMAISYVPVFGTAVSFLINTSVSLAQGASVDSAFLDGVGGALPGQPLSGAAFSATRSILRGDSFIDVAISGLPLDASVKHIISTTVDVMVALSRGQTITDVALDQLHAQLPDIGKRAMDVASGLIRGEHIAGLVVDADMQAVVDEVKSRGQAAINEYVAQAGFQRSLDMLDPLLQNALYAGMMAGASEIHQFVGVFDASEHDVASNDALAAKGRAIMAAGAKWRGRLLSNVRAAGRLRFTLPMYDQLSATTQPRVNVYEITDQWRRGFDVAIGLCEGMSENGPGQQRVKQSLGQWDAKRGFDVGQRMQHERTLGAFRIWAASDSIGAVVKLQGLDGRPAIIAANPRAAAAVLDESERPDSETAGKLSEREQILRSIITNPYDHGAFR